MTVLDKLWFLRILGERFVLVPIMEPRETCRCWLAVVTSERVGRIVDKSRVAMGRRLTTGNWNFDCDCAVVIASPAGLLARELRVRTAQSGLDSLNEELKLSLSNCQSAQSAVPVQ